MREILTTRELNPEVTEDDDNILGAITKEGRHF
jgi:hypothetical protein